jgi:hypothetical protein
MGQDNPIVILLSVIDYLFQCLLAKHVIAVCYKRIDLKPERPAFRNTALQKLLGMIARIQVAYYGNPDRTVLHLVGKVLLEQIGNFRTVGRLSLSTTRRE